MKFRFDQNDDLVIDDIPDDVMAAIEARASANGRTAEDEMRDLLTGLFRPAASDTDPESPLP